MRTPWTLLSMTLCAACAAPSPPRVTAVRLQHADAANIRDILTQLLADTGGRADFSVDAGENTLLVHAAPPESERVLELVASLDRPFTPEVITLGPPVSAELEAAVRKAATDVPPASASSSRGYVRRRRHPTVRRDGATLVIEGSGHDLARLREKIPELRR